MSTPTTQTAHPWRASIRTGGTVFVTGALAAAVVAPEVQAFVDTVAPGTPAAAFAATAVTVTGAAAVLVNRLILLQPVADLLDKLGLGPAPKEKASDEVAPF